jgi:flagellar basal-body rod protein FlgC
MDFGTGFRISSSGMKAQTVRMNTVSSNIANAGTVGYKRKDVVLEALPDAKSFGEMMMATDPESQLSRVQVTDIHSDTNKPLLKYEPDHPDADENGMVAYPNVNLVEEYANMIQTSRAYEANVSALNATKDMAMSALNIGE